MNRQQAIDIKKSKQHCFYTGEILKSLKETPLCISQIAATLDIAFVYPSETVREGATAATREAMKFFYGAWVRLEEIDERPSPLSPPSDN